MKLVATICTAIFIAFGFSSVLFGQEAHRSFTLTTTGGTPGSAGFRVLISEDASLCVSKESFPITKDGHLTKASVTVVLTKDEMNHLFDLASKAEDFSEKSPKPYADGTTAVMVLQLGAHSIKRECSNAPKWPIGSQTKVLLAEINKHLSKEMQVF